ncbi:MAG: hypothetical protein LBK73_05450 [Treponema sp.]|jgi:hypothetical protein|nr:hypothetical protein [Treponema sp.]
MYELFAKAGELEESLLTRIVRNRMAAENKRTPDEMRRKRRHGRAGAAIPRGGRGGVPEREAALRARHAPFAVKRPHILNPVKTPPESAQAAVVYVKEGRPSKRKGSIEWLLMANKPVNTVEEAYKHGGCHMRRWKMERLHYAPKSGRAVEKLQERSAGKTAAPILTRSIIAVMTLNMTHMGCLEPETPCSALPGPDERKLPYRIANKTKREPKKAHTIKEAVDYLGRLGGPKRAPSDGPPGVKTIWMGVMKLYILLARRQYPA